MYKISGSYKMIKTCRSVILLEILRAFKYTILRGVRPYWELVWLSNNRLLLLLHDTLWSVALFLTKTRLWQTTIFSPLPRQIKSSSLSYLVPSLCWYVRPGGLKTRTILFTHPNIFQVGSVIENCVIITNVKQFNYKKTNFNVPLVSFEQNFLQLQL